MRKSRFTEEQIVAILKENGGRHAESKELARRHGDLPEHDLQLAPQVRRSRGQRSQASESARGGECSKSEEDSWPSKQLDITCLEGRGVKKVVSPASRRSAAVQHHARRSIRDERTTSVRVSWGCPEVRRAVPEHRRREPEGLTGTAARARGRATTLRLPASARLAAARGLRASTTS